MEPLALGNRRYTKILEQKIILIKYLSDKTEKHRIIEPTEINIPSSDFLGAKKGVNHVTR